MQITSEQAEERILSNLRKRNTYKSYDLTEAQTMVLSWMCFCVGTGMSETMTLAPVHLQDDWSGLGKASAALDRY